MIAKKRVQISEYGKRMGESHGRAKLSDHEVDLIIQLKEDGMPAQEIADKFEIGRRYVYKLCNFERRSCRIDESRTLSLASKKGRKYRRDAETGVIASPITLGNMLTEEENRATTKADLSSIVDLPRARQGGRGYHGRPNNRPDWWVRGKRNG